METTEKVKVRLTKKELEIWPILAKLICENLEIDEKLVRLNARFRQDLGADSLETYELVYAIEEELEVRIPDDVATEIETVLEALQYLAKQLHGDDKLTEEVEEDEIPVYDHGKWSGPVNERPENVPEEMPTLTGKLKKSLLNNGWVVMTRTVYMIPPGTNSCHGYELIPVRTKIYVLHYERGAGTEHIYVKVKKVLRKLIDFGNPLIMSNSPKFHVNEEYCTFYGHDVCVKKAGGSTYIVYDSIHKRISGEMITKVVPRYRNSIVTMIKVHG